MEKSIFSELGEEYGFDFAHFNGMSGEYYMAEITGSGGAFVDYDNDGDLDLFMTHLVTETNTLYRNDGHGSFTDITMASGLGPPSRVYTSFGTGWLDFDNDGWWQGLEIDHYHRLRRGHDRDGGGE